MEKQAFSATSLIARREKSSFSDALSLKGGFSEARVCRSITRLVIMIFAVLACYGATTVPCDFHAQGMARRQQPKSRFNRIGSCMAILYAAPRPWSYR